LSAGAFWIVYTNHSSLPSAAPISHVLKSAYLHGSKPHHNPLCRPLTTLSRLCIYESWRACILLRPRRTATGASSNPFAISVDGRAFRVVRHLVPHRSCSNAFPRLPDVPSTPRSGISVPPPHSGTQRSNWTSFELSTPMPANETRDLRWASTSFLPPSTGRWPRPANASSASGTGIHFGRLLPLRSAALRSQRFWDHMNYLDDRRCSGSKTTSRGDWWRNGRSIYKRCFTTPPTSTRSFPREPARLAQRGHAKSKRTDLRIVGWRCWSPGIFIIPLFSQIYEGNQNDSVTLQPVLDDLVTRYQMFSREMSEHHPGFRIREQFADNFEDLDGSPTISLVLWSPPNTKIF